MIYFGKKVETGKKVKTHKPRYCEKQMYKANKRMA
jgi:hypothetical protein